MPPTPADQVSRFGVLGGDNAGFPNGRRLGDDVVDIELRVIGGFLLPPDQGGKKLPLGDGVDQNDKPFLSTFPYVAPPTAGFDSEIKQTEPGHTTRLRRSHRRTAHGPVARTARRARGRR